MTDTAEPDVISARRPWRTAIIAGMASYLDAGAIVTTGAALVLYGPALGVSELDFGLVSALLTLCFAVGALVGGRLGDRFGRRRVFTVTLLVYVVGALLLAGAVAVPMLYVGVVLIGFAVGADLPVSLALIAEEAPEGKKGKMIGFSTLLWMIGGIVPGFGTAAVSSLGELGARILFGHLVIVGVVVLLLRLGLRESAEWSAARRVETASLLEGTGHDEVRFAHLGQLFRPPILLTVVALGLYYGLWNLVANTNGQFGGFIWVNVAGLTLQGSALSSLAIIPLAIVGTLIFLRVVDRPARRGWFVFGTALSTLGLVIPAIFGVSFLTLLMPIVLFGIGSVFSGEAIYKVWSQELVPTLLRSTAQGVTLAFARILAAAFAVVTPAFVTAAPQVFYGVLALLAVSAAAIGLVVIPRLPKAADLETPVVVVESVPDDSRRSPSGR